MNFFLIIQALILTGCALVGAHGMVKKYHVLPQLFSFRFLGYSFLAFFVCSVFCLTSLGTSSYGNFYTQFFLVALSITLFTDAFTLLISPLVTTWLIGFIWFAAYQEALPISFFESIAATITAYGSLSLIRYLSSHILKKESMGAGDIDLLSFIAAFLGFTGTWLALTVGSCCGALYGILCILVGKDKQKLQLPFGTFLCIGAMIAILWKN